MKGGEIMKTIIVFKTITTEYPNGNVSVLRFAQTINAETGESLVKEEV